MRVDIATLQLSNAFNMVNFRFPQKLAEQLHLEAKTKNMSVTAFVAQLLREHKRKLRYLKRRTSRLARNDAVTQRLNKIYSKEDSSLDPALAKLQTRTLLKYGELED